MNFWNKSKKKNRPILCLAPMADVTDRAFRQMIAKYGKPDVMWTEFVSADGLFKGGKEALINDLIFTKKEKPIVAQFFTSSPEMMEKAAALAVELGFDGVDINMGCPDKGVEKQNAGAKLIKNPKLAREIIKAAKRGTKNKIAVSVKTRIGYSKSELETWLPELLAENPAAIIIHARTRKDLSLIPADWKYIKMAVEIRNKLGSKTLIIGNGDIESLQDAKQKMKETKCDGIMIGRGFFGKPWLLSNSYEWFNDRKNPEVVREILKILVEHVKLFEKIVQPNSPKGQGKSFAVMKKHFKAYVNGFTGAKELRIRLMKAENVKEVANIVKNFLILYN
jgi:nifR3 family TIM-barrel protein